MAIEADAGAGMGASEERVTAAEDSSEAMKLHGTILDNLRSAVASAEKLRDRPVYRDTLAFWQALLDEAARMRPGAEDGEDAVYGTLMERLEQQLAARAQAGGTASA